MSEKKDQIKMVNSSDQRGPILSRRQLILAGGALVTGGLLVAACGDNDATDSGSAAGGEPEKPEKIIMRSWGEPYSTSIEEFAGVAFTARTGIPVEYDLTDFGEVRVKVEEAFRAGTRPSVDIVYTTGPEAYVASQQKYALPLDTALLTNYADLSVPGKPDDGSTNWVNIYTYTIPLLYRKDLVTLPVDMHWDELWDPKYKGLVGIRLDPNYLVWSLCKVYDLDPATDDLTRVWDRCKELKPNIGAIYNNDTELITMLNAGEIAIAFSLPGNVLSIENDNGALMVPQPGVMLTSDSLYIPAGTPDNVKYWAQQFIDEIIGPVAQTGFNKAIGAVPTNVLATPSDYMSGQPSYPFTDEEIAKYAITVRNDIFAKFRDEWTEKFTVALQG